MSMRTKAELAKLSGEQLASRLDGVAYDYRQAAAYEAEGQDIAG